MQHGMGHAPCSTESQSNKIKTKENKSICVHSISTFHAHLLSMSSAAITQLMSNQFALDLVAVKSAGQRLERL